MKQILIILFLITSNLLADNKSDTNLFMTYPYFKDITKLETEIYLNQDAKKILYKQGLKDFLDTTLRAKIGKSINNLEQSKYKDKKLLAVDITLYGPYNDKLDIYYGTIELLVQIDKFGRSMYRKIYRIANSKSKIQKDVEEAIEMLVKWFVQDYYKIVDFDYSKMSNDDKIFFLFKYRDDLEYIFQRFDIWNTIKKDQQTFSYIFDDLSKKVKREKLNSNDKNTRYGYLKPLNKVKNIVVRFWDYSKSPTFKYANQFCVDENDDGILDYGLQEYTTNRFLLGINKRNKYFYYDLLKCNDDIQKFYDKKRNKTKVSIENAKGITGTGFFVSNGILLTNYHVVKDSNKIFIIYNNKKYNATILSKDKTNDIAILKTDINNQIYLPLANYPEIQKGDDVISMGYPLVQLQGNELKATFGHINALSGIQGDFRFFQIDNPTQPGNSGSPLLNQYGEVIGLVSARLNQETTLKYSGTLSQNVNYALKIDYILPLIKHNKIKNKTLTYKKRLKNKDIIKKYEKSVVLIISEK
jgi:S1-C subfamily serine protease